jgi:hypothetical protein
MPSKNMSWDDLQAKFDKFREQKADADKFVSGHGERLDKISEESRQRLKNVSEANTQRMNAIKGGGAGSGEGGSGGDGLLKNEISAKNPVYKRGGKVMEHKHKIEHEKKHAAGHMHEQEKVAKHYGSGDHKMHHEHVKAMCGGGKMKAK